MAAKVRHLLNREGRFFARLVIPKELRPFMDRKTELRTPLGSDYRTALKKLPGAVALLQHEIALAERRAGADGRAVTIGRYPLAVDQIALRNYQTRLAFDEELRNSDPRYALHGFVDEQLAARLRDGMAGRLTDDELDALIGTRIERYLRSFRGWLADIGNMSVWEKIGRLLGGDYSPEGMARAGIYDPTKTGGGIGSDRVVGGESAPLSLTVNKPVSIKDAPADGSAGKGTKVRENDYERLTQLIQDRTGAVQAETAAQAGLNPLVNDYGFAVERARAQYDLLQAAHEAGLTITPELSAQIDNLASAYANASVTAAQLAETQQRAQQVAGDFNALGRDVFAGFISDMRAGVSGAQALTNALGKVADKLIEIGLNALFSPAGSGTGGLFGVVGKALGFSAGGYTGTGGKYEPAGVVHKGEVVWSQDDVRRAGGVPVVEAMRRGARGYATGGVVAPALSSMPSLRLNRKGAGVSAAASVTQNISVAPSITVNASGGTPAQNEDLANRIGMQVEQRMRAVVVDELITQMRPGNLLGG